MNDSSGGDRLGALYARHGPEAVRLAYLLTGDRELSEDLVQEAFIKVAGRLTGLRNADSFWWYLRRTVVNLANSYQRHRRVERAYARGLIGSAAVADPGSWPLRSRDHTAGRRACRMMVPVA